LLESDALLAHAVGQPMVLVEADTGGEWKVRTDAHEHSSPVPVIDVKVVLNDPALRELEVPAVRDLVADGRMTTTASGLARSKYGSTNSSRRPFGASTIGMLRFTARSFTQG
jgi:hypothetical protein